MRSEEVRKALGLYFVMGTPNTNGNEPLAVLESALRGGITCFQLREKGPGALKGEELAGFARKCQALCRLYRVPFIVNDDVDLAIAIHADGVHVGQDDEHVLSVRERIGPDLWLGVSVHNADEMLAAQRLGADYVGVGPIYPTATKPDASAVVGPALIEELRLQFPEMPMVGIGGIDLTNFGPVLHAGGNGVAVISAIAGAEDPSVATKEFSETVRSILHS